MVHRWAAWTALQRERQKVVTTANTMVYCAAESLALMREVRRDSLKALRTVEQTEMKWAQ